MGWAETAARQAAAAKAGAPSLSIAPRDGFAGAAPSEWLEQTSRQFEAETIGQVNAIAEALKPRAIITGVGGGAPVPQVDPVKAILGLVMQQARLLAAMNDMLLTFLTGRPELRPAVPAGNGQPPLEGGPKEPAS